MKMEKILVRMEKVEKMEKTLSILEKIIVTMPSLMFWITVVNSVLHDSQKTKLSQNF